ncbi:glutathione S-transferase family protein [Amorphus sp. 3PC139-8]|uniref:glutathione S-transferase family protein n=1 Tax=Amorphus sp. 3PC139-8 TaxID=2735676 RepID=UPI00345DCD3C
MITVTALKWVPPFAAGQVRDHRVRWVLNEAGWDYEVDLMDPKGLEADLYRAEQPFGQVPVMRETGRPTLFESGAIVLDVAERSGRLWPADADQQALVRSWVVAALNSVEPFLMNLAEVDVFLRDPEHKRLRRPGVVATAKQRLERLSAALGSQSYLVGDMFTAADLMMSSVLKIAGGTELLDDFQNLAAFCDRCFARPAHRKAVADQRQDIAQYGPEDMGWDPALFASVN